jgi:MFS transporter, DHA1 family, multidrug resistance protein
MGYREFVVLMALITSATALSIDAVLPALPLIGDELGAADENHRQLAVGALLAGLAFSQLVFGPLSDSLGRKPVIFLGIGLFAVGCLICIWAPSFDILLAGRLLQGFGAGGPRVVSVAVIRDRFEGRFMAKTISLVMTIFILVPVFAPAIGQGILLLAHWHAIFWFYLATAAITALWVYVRLPETLSAENRHPLSPTRVFLALREIVTHRGTVGYLLSSAFIFAALVGYLTSAQQVLQELYGLGNLFPLAFGLLACSLGVSSFVNSRLVVRFGMGRLARGSLAAQVFFGVVFVAVASWFDGVPPLWLLFVVMAPFFFCAGTVFGNLNALAMQPMGHIAGSAAAVIGATSTAISTFMGSMVGQSYNETVLPMALGFAVFGGLSLFFCLWAEGRST